MYRSVVILPFLGLLTSCDSPRYTHIETPINQSIDNSEFQLDAFGGTLYGEDRGEWIGGLYFRDQADRAYEVINQNVHGIIRNKSGIFVFTGLAHLGTNEGFIYRLTVNSKSEIVPSRVGRLPGMPLQVIQHENGTTSFLTFTGYVKDEQHFKCLALNGDLVVDSNQCDPPNL